MATNREKEILRLIEANPLISQQELADTCGITRSSVAVHISNLMRKGFIQGKGYITSSKPHIAVVGGSTFDISGAPSAALIRKEKNAGRIVTNGGGTGRDIALILALLGENVKFVSVFGDDAIAKPLMESSLQAGVDITNAPIVPGGTTSINMRITNGAGETQLAISDFELYNSITPAFLSKRLQVINNAAVCVVEANLPTDSLTYLAQNCTAPLFVECVSLEKTDRLIHLLPFTHTLKANRAEASVLSNIKIKDARTLETAVEVLLAKGISQVFITLGAEGVYCADKKESLLLPGVPAKIRKNTGSGGSFMAALAWAFNQGFTLKTSAKAGLVASAMSLEASDAISPNVNEQNMLRILQDTE